ncbi:class I SAM-dependent methyltransferase [Actinomadura rudentiformis]|uniref:Methyltransferase domain-containing protein n=1 Tax=Actinomadura rudentiformis TaxID=359158 RepID=A0A6H9YNH7_9ACTN|nr:class I SAM-dependent methyltransferase [Actinomadura rudentiformis]KAB2344082.1 methyltransferase domain-containing protein [Actinomadura rudentiformis]
MIEQEDGLTDRYSSGVLSHDIPTELTRLQLLEEHLDPVTLGVLGARAEDLPDSARCLELGAGAGSVARWLSGRFPAGTVTAVDIDVRYLDPSWAPNLVVQEGDLRLLDFPTGSFDLIHARALLMHLPEREEIVKRLASWLAPGGWLVLEDIAHFPKATSPNPAWRKAMTAVVDLLSSQGEDTEWARRRQPAILADAGLADLGLALEVFTVGDGGVAERFWRVFLNQLRPALVDRDLITDGELDAALALFDDPRFVDAAEAIVSAWGRQPTP